MLGINALCCLGGRYFLRTIDVYALANWIRGTRVQMWRMLVDPSIPLRFYFVHHFRS